MKKVFLLLMFAVILLVSKSYSQDRWVYIGYTIDKGDIIYYDNETIKYVGNDIKLNTKMVHTKTSHFYNLYNIKETVFKMILYCGEERIKYISATYYFKDGSNKYEKSNEYNDVVPGTVGEAIYSYFCK